MGAGDHHGIYANNVCILKDSRDGSCSVEGRLEHSKTKAERWINMVGTTKTSNVQVAGILAQYWKESGIQVTTRAEGNFVETRPDYWVVRVSLLATPAGFLEKLGKVLAGSAVKEVRDLANDTIGRAQKRMNLKNDAEEKAFVNVAGGTKSGSQIKQVMLELDRAGLGRWARVTMGPLIRSTSGFRLTHSALSPDSTYKLLGLAMEKAYLLANSESAGPDPELDLNGALKPSWSHHSWRRFADKVARQSRGETGASDVDIDLFFGWMEAFYRKLMQLHYAGRNERVARNRVTMMV